MPIFGESETGVLNLPKLPFESIVVHFQGVICCFFMYFNHLIMEHVNFPFCVLPTAKVSWSCI